MKEAVGVRAGLAVARDTSLETPPGGASDSHRHTYASLLGKPFLGAMRFADFPAGGAEMDGKYGIDTTNHRLVWYEGGQRRASAAGAVV